MADNRPVLTRRRLLAGGALALPAAAWLARPAEQGGPHNAYFEGLSAALREAGLAQACLVLDLPRLRANLAAIAQHQTQTGMALRAVLKSLPSLAVMKEVALAWRSDKVMAFNAAQTAQLLLARPQSEVLLGKPLPAAAAHHLLQTLPPALIAKIEWLIDTPERLAQYQLLAQALPAGQALRMNLEIDVGLHRGGFEERAQIGNALRAIQGSGGRLQWSGLMGYDAHVAALPEALGLRRSAWDGSQRRYQAAWATAHSVMAEQAAKQLSLNTAGSPTFRLHDGRGVANEVSVGSAAVLPLDFEKPLLADLLPALFIATPVLKSWPQFRLPEGVTWLSQLAQTWDPNQAQGLAVHGGHWLAQPVSPPGVLPSGLFGHSSNQQVMVASRRVRLRPDDHVFLRPLQSEALMLQFGDLAVFDGQHISERWPVLPASA
ncbi:alanine racemase [Paucibacter sp. B2R-40]|uniref:alanine racemase n=1 Tax=Paucibacter sp. B2R-40 TaxID=2893554 RepID=UPI0021E4DA68|nr:alanine racemase [Paucibacter sp. B2R-40]MCV2356943.1 alanine racemase [Paucibacter sp. B2R-40]